MIGSKLLCAIMPTLRADLATRYVPHIQAACLRFSIDRPAREAAFLGQLAHESGGLRYWEEIASGDAYEDRADLGNTHPGDGRRYKGRGPIQLTGRANYRRAGQALGINIEDAPEQVSSPSVGCQVAAWFWADKKLNILADEDSEDAYRRITRRIHGGLNGWQDRLTYWRRARLALGLPPL
jgi:predicted chitinase